MGRLRRLRQVDRLRGAFDDPDARVQRSALEAAAMSGLPGLEDWCRRAALDPEAPSLEAMRFLGVFGAATDLALLEAAAEDEECAAAALDAIGMLGRVEAIPRLVALIEAGAPSDRPAALAYRRITGMEDLAADKPPAPPIDPTDVDSEFDDDEPPPDVERARAWWAQHADRFDPARRFKDGVDVSAGWAAAASPLISLASTLELQLAACASDPEATAASVELAGRARGRAAG
jgi:hypothetical protein